MSKRRVDLSEDVVKRSHVSFVSGDYQGDSGYSQERHVHVDCWQGDWVLTGSMTYRFDDAVMTAQAGAVVFIPPKVAHELDSKDGFLVRAIKFRLPVRSVDGRPIFRRITDPLHSLLAREVFSAKGTLPWDMNAAYFGALLCLLQPPAEDPPNESRGNDPILRVQEYVLRHLHHALTVPTLAEIAHLSVSQFVRRFRAATGTSPGKWVSRQRIARAEELLRHTNLSISEIALQTGYDDLPSFSKAFRRSKGVSPSKLRNALNTPPGIDN